jgi:integrase
MSSIEKRPSPSGPRWVVRYRVNGLSRSRTFSTEREAKAFRTSLDHDALRGVSVDPVLGRTTLGEFWDSWLPQQPFRPNTKSTYSATRRHLGPLADVPMAKIRPMDVEGWLQGLDQADSTKRLHLNRLRSVLNAAVTNGFLAVNPATRAKGPRRPAPGATVSLTDEDVKAVIQAMPRNGSAALLAASTGLRLGEIAGLRVQDIDWLNGEVHVRQQRGGAPLKSPSAERTIPLGRGLVDALGPRAAGKGPEDYLFPSGKDIQETFRRAAKKAGVQARFHDLRGYAASRWIRQGLSVVEVQRLLGHANAATTLATYAREWADQSDRQREATTEISRVLGYGLQTLSLR